MASNQTSNYGLNQWEATDQVLRTEFNADNQKIDAALQSQVASIAALTGQLSKKGNCQMELITYMGSGSYGTGSPTTVQFSNLPEIFIIVGGGAVLLGRGGVSQATMIVDDTFGAGTFVNNEEFSWTGNQLSMSNHAAAQYQMNKKNTVYWVAGLWRCRT